MTLEMWASPALWESQISLVKYYSWHTKFAGCWKHSTCDAGVEISSLPVSYSKPGLLPHCLLYSHTCTCKWEIILWQQMNITRSLLLTPEWAAKWKNVPYLLPEVVKCKCRYTFSKQKSIFWIPSFMFLTNQIGQFHLLDCLLILTSGLLTFSSQYDAAASIASQVYRRWRWNRTDLFQHLQRQSHRSSTIPGPDFCDKKPHLLMKSSIGCMVCI